MKFVGNRFQQSRINHLRAITLVSEYNLQTDFALYGESGCFEYV